MAPSRPPSSMARWTAKSWAAAATAAAAAATLAISASPRRAQAFVPPAAPRPSLLRSATRETGVPIGSRDAEFALGGTLSVAAAARIVIGEVAACGEQRWVGSAGGQRSRGLVAPCMMSMSGNEEDVGESGDRREGGGEIPVSPAKLFKAATEAASVGRGTDEVFDDEEIDRIVAARKVVGKDPYAEEEEEEDDDEGEVYEEIIANMTKPLGITIEASTDAAELIYVTSVGEQAEDAGLEVGDVLTGVSGVFGGDVWSVKGKTIEKVRSLVRCRSEPYILVRVERGHVSLEDRCSPRFGLSDDELGRLEDGDECEIDYMELWRAVYKDEMEVLNKGSRLGGGGNGKGKKMNNPPPPPLPPTDRPGAGSFSGDPWESTNF